MNYDEIDQLRKSGNLDEAYQKASLALKEANQVAEGAVELQQVQASGIDDDDEQALHNGQENPLVKSKNAMAWVLYDYMKQNTQKENYHSFYQYLIEYIALDLGEQEKLITNQVLWVLAKMVFEYTKEADFEVAEMEKLFDVISDLNFSRQNKGYSMLFKAFHKALKDSTRYIDLVEWWDFNNFIRDDYNHVKNDDGTRIMAIVEQSYTKYAKHLINALENADDEPEKNILQQKINAFIPRVREVCRRNKFYKKLPQYQVKLMVAGGEFSKAFELLINKAKEQQPDFWVWEMIANAFDAEPEKKLACLCAAATCKTNARKIVEVRQKIAEMFLEKQLFNEAKTEIALILRTCQYQKMEIPELITEWGDQSWYRQSVVKENNIGTYKQYKSVTDDIIFHDIPQRKVVVEFVNQPRKILNFIGTDLSKGYFRYGNNLGKVKEGDVLLVRMSRIDNEGRHELINAKKTGERHIDGLLREFAGQVLIPPNKPFGFVSDLFIPPDICKDYRLEDGERITGLAMLSYNRKKEDWGWKVVSVD
jgi:hypothetical protein